MIQDHSKFTCYFANLSHVSPVVKSKTNVLLKGLKVRVWKIEVWSLRRNTCMCHKSVETWFLTFVLYRLLSQVLLF
jgi:hypothetical protein